MTNKYLFDSTDKKTFEFLKSVKNTNSASADDLILNAHLHPHGIKELLEPKQLRVAKSILLLIHAMDKGTIDERLSALHSLRDEVIFCSENSMPKNTARLLLTIMKSIVRSENETEQLELLHIFTMLMRAKSKTIRTYLEKYNLLEMPEEWNQIAFDHHVHDSYTKGRKTPTHLIMDAWIKGIKRLTVIYYDYAPKEAVRELLLAASYMYIKVRINIESIIMFNGKKVRLMWTPNNLPDAEHWMSFLNKDETVEFFRQSIEQAEDHEKITKVSKVFSSPEDFFQQIEKLSNDNRVTLNLAGLTDYEVLELLFECKGRITNIEIFNSKDFKTRQSPYLAQIAKIRTFINEKNTAKLKKAIKKMSERIAVLVNMPQTSDAAPQETLLYDAKYHAEQLNKILLHLDELFNWYEYQMLYDRWGTDSVGKASEERTGMGFALLETLPAGAQKFVLKHKDKKLLPVNIPATYRENFLPKKGFHLPFTSKFIKINSEWIAQPYSNSSEEANLVALGEYSADFEKKQELAAKKAKGISYYWQFMPTKFKNIIKIVAGFIPAFLAMYLTKDWFILKYFGAVIWFAITGIRNIIQAVVSGDCRHRSKLLHWTSYIDWSRISDSLFFTGISVPLIDSFAKTWLLQEKLGMTIATNPIIVYTVMSIVNGFYISFHNVLRGLPKSDAIANFFRSVIAIPFAFFLNSIFGSAMLIFGIALPEINDMLQKFASIISKLASDILGGIIEGLSTRKKNISLRKLDYRRKFYQMQRTCTHLEFLFPTVDIVKALKKPELVVERLKAENPRVLKSLVFDALDFFYFWLFQPHARTVLIPMLKKMHKRSRNLFLNYQNILSCRQIVTEILAKNADSINFKLVYRLYLEHISSYLNTVKHLTNKGKWDDSAEKITQEDFEIEGSDNA